MKCNENEIYKILVINSSTRTNNILGRCHSFMSNDILWNNKEKKMDTS